MRVSKNQSNELEPRRRKLTLRRGLLAIAILAVAIAGVSAMMTSAETHDEGISRDESAPASEQVVPDHSGDESKNLNRAAEINLAVSIRRPLGPPRVVTGLRDFHGNEVLVACSTCHTTRQPNRQNASPKDLDEFHGGLKFSHGTVSCLSCHNDQDYDALKLADGTRVEFSNVMTLCAQCHGPQMKAYQHGAHGGMNGHWDLTRGSQTKNNCIDCHDPHTPQFPKMQPTFKPRDRFLEKPRTEH